MSLHDFLSQHCQFCLLLGLQLRKKIADLAVAHHLPLLIFLALDLSDLSLDFVGANIIFLPG